MPRNKKQNKVQKTNTPVTSNGWKSETFKIAYKDTVEIGDYTGGGKLYGYIDEKFCDDPRWEIALSKGFTKTAKGQNGVKWGENHQLLKIKIKDDARVYTTKVYKNDKGDYLAYFDNESNHKGIARIESATKSLDIISVDDYYTENTTGKEFGLIGNEMYELETY